MLLHQQPGKPRALPATACEQRMSFNGHALFITQCIVFKLAHPPHTARPTPPRPCTTPHRLAGSGSCTTAWRLQAARSCWMKPAACAQRSPRQVVLAAAPHPSMCVPQCMHASPSWGSAVLQQGLRSCHDLHVQARSFSRGLLHHHAPLCALQDDWRQLEVQGVVTPDAPLHGDRAGTVYLPAFRMPATNLLDLLTTWEKVKRDGEAGQVA